MENNTELIEMIGQRCTEYGIGDFQTLRPGIQQQLLKLEQYFLDSIATQHRIADERKRLGKLTLLTASTLSQVQRSSIYNNPNTLKSYIEMRIAEINEMDILGSNELDNLRQKSRDLETCIEGFRTRLVEQEALRLQIAELERELANLNTMHQSVLEQNYSLQAELDRFHLRANSQSNVLFINKDNG